VDGETAIAGTLADSVQEVMNLDPDHIEPAPKIGTKLNVEFIKGMGKQGEHFTIIIDIDKIFSNEEFALVQKPSVDAAGEPAE
jgi:purine-binding chemotaxis protein CheW